VDHTFGTLDHDGFQARWSRRGAGIRHILLNNEYTSSSAEKKEQKEKSDYYSIVGEYRPEGFYGLVLQDRAKAQHKRFKRDIEADVWEVEKQADSVRFFLDMGDGLILEKVFRYQPGRRDLELIINLKSKAEREDKLPREYLLLLRGVEVWNPTEDQLLYNPAGTIAATLDAKGEPQVVWAPANKQPEKPFPELVSTTSQRLDFAGTTNRFFAAFLYPQDASTQDAVSGVNYVLYPEQEYQPRPDATIAARSMPMAFYKLRLNVPAKGETESLKFRLYLGPKSTKVFAEKPETAAEYERFGVIMDQDLSPACCINIPGVRPLAKGLIWLLRLLQSGVGNWGVAIFFLTLIVRGCLSPLNFRMQKTMREFGQKMALLKPQLDALQKKYQNDPKQLQAEMMKFNREHKLMSQPLKGCLPLLLTMPIWIGLFTALRVMYELRQQPLAFWVDDLSVADRMFHLGIPFVEHFNLLPLLMVALWWLLQRGTPLPKDPQQRQMAVMMRFMPLMFGVLLYNYAAGLMVYMITSSLWGIVEQRITKKILGPISPDAVQAGTVPMM
jgi:YidC/Oxa1 family membrane protein insertase